MYVSLITRGGNTLVSFGAKGLKVRVTIVSSFTINSHYQTLKCKLVPSDSVPHGLKRYFFHENYTLVPCVVFKQISTKFFVFIKVLTAKTFFVHTLFFADNTCLNPNLANK